LDDPDAEKLKISNLIQTGIEPRLASFELHWIPIEGTRGFLIVRVPRSWAAPHRVTLKGHDKFYIRDGGGKHPMNVDELRRAFSLAESVTSRIRQFRLDRTRDILSDNGPTKLVNGAKLVVHVIPVSAFVEAPSLNFDSQLDTVVIRPIASASAYTSRHTFEGYMSFTPDCGLGVQAFTLAFREGILEAVATIACEIETKKHMPLRSVKQHIEQAWDVAKKFHTRFARGSPYYTLVSLLEVRGYQAIVSPDGYGAYSSPSRHDQLHFPETSIDEKNYNETFDDLFRDTLRTLANAFGLERLPGD
jgi:hypothetical protein